MSTGGRPRPLAVGNNGANTSHCSSVISCRATMTQTLTSRHPELVYQHALVRMRSDPRGQEVRRQTNEARPEPPGCHARYIARELYPLLLPPHADLDDIEASVHRTGHQLAARVQRGWLGRSGPPRGALVRRSDLPVPV